MKPVAHNTFVIERTYNMSPAALFAALADPKKKKRWYAASADSFEMDFRPEGWERTRSRMGPDTPFPGTALDSDAVYQDIVDGQRVVMAQTMSLGGRHISTALITFEVEEAEGSSKLVFTHQAAFYEGSDGPEMRQHGWNYLLDRLV